MTVLWGDEEKTRKSPIPLSGRFQAIFKGL
jgi:hypothetical protein